MAPLREALDLLSVNINDVKVLNVWSMLGASLMSTYYRATYVDPSQRICELKWTKTVWIGIRITDRLCGAWSSAKDGKGKLVGEKKELIPDYDEH
ncbi:hypothetical protein GE061_012570 [Apolygus lucorum]|uniref:Uncharacterized protein n=1 Tax=Apolygus lucorum TaxID=248454 RepID=A0A8S9XSP1_APOLU|nr:hypothetical protein GE061_012570 [Apolygus lucorum]